MPINYTYPGIYVEEVSSGANPIQAASTSTAGFIGTAPDPNVYQNEAHAVNNWAEFQRIYANDAKEGTHLSNAVFGFFQNGGSRCYIVNIPKGQSIGDANRQRGLALLEEIEDISIIAAPGYCDVVSYNALIDHCERLKFRVAILDAVDTIDSIDSLSQIMDVTDTSKQSDENPKQAGKKPRSSDHAAFYFPWLKQADPLSTNGTVVNIPPSGHIAGIWARTDTNRGVHKAPANEPVRGAVGLTYRVTSSEQGQLNPNGINCIRQFPKDGIMVWGARTLATEGNWRYINVRRLFNMIERSILDSTRWIVFEPNDRLLWSAVRRDVSAFLTRLWRDGALMGATAQQAFFVQCDETTNPQENVDAGIVTTIIGIAPVKPAEFVVFKISQSNTGTQIEA
jgi:uncharacterized protein